jgi:hypothetical protein
MNIHFRWFAATIVASAACAPFHPNEAARPRLTAASPCSGDSTFQRLAFWIGNWEVYDSTGVYYANQRVHPVLDGCALTVEWSSGRGNKGIGISAFDGKTREWRQIYVGNQVPYPESVKLRRSDPSYDGPGIRFIPLPDSAGANLRQTRVTIMPLSGHRALEEFEDSPDAGKTWHTVFKAEHRLEGSLLP